MTCFKSKFIIYKVVLYGNIEAEIRKMMHGTSFLITKLVTSKLKILWLNMLQCL